MSRDVTNVLVDLKNQVFSSIKNKNPFSSRQNSVQSVKDGEKKEEETGVALSIEGQLTVTDEIKLGFVEIIALIGPFFIGSILAISNGYFFSGFQEFNLTNIPIFVAWMSGFALEAINLAALFHAANQLKQNNRAAFWKSFLFALVLASISFIAQYIYLEMEYKSGNLQVSDTAIENIPFFSLFIGINNLSGHDVLFIVRAVAYHLAEFACTFLISKKGLSIERAMEIQNKQFQLNSAREQQEMVIKLMKSTTDAMKQLTERQNEVLIRAFTKVEEEVILESGVQNGRELPSPQELPNGGGKRMTKEEVEEMMRQYDKTGEFPDHVSDAMKKYYIKRYRGGN